MKEGGAFGSKQPSTKIISLDERRATRKEEEQKPIPAGGAEVIEIPYVEELRRYIEGLRLAIRKEFERREKAGVAYETHRRDEARKLVAFIPNADALHEQILDMSTRDCAEDPYECEALLDAFEKERTKKRA